MKGGDEFAVRLQAIIDTAIDGIITIDSRGVVESINPAGAQIFQYDPLEVIGQNITMLMPQRYAADHDGYLKRYEKTRQAHIIGIGREVSGLRRDGTEFPFRLAVSEVILHDRIIYTGIVHDLSDIKSAEEEILKINKELEKKVAQRTAELEGVVNQLLLTNRNLSEEVTLRKKAESDLQESLSKEKELNEMKSRFVSMASHEFRTPLTSVLSSAALLARYDQTEQQSKRLKHVDKIKSAVANLTGILNDFLSLSKLEEGRVEVSSTHFDIVELSQETIDDLDSLLKNDQRIIIDVKSTKTHVKTDKRVLKNILFNLLSNAIKYSSDSIELGIDDNDGKYIITVKDSGIGIPADEQKHLFSRFFRASNSINIKGTGLGLNIVKRYVQLLDGEINYDSAENIGTTFYLTIPK